MVKFNLRSINDLGKSDYETTVSPVNFEQPLTRDTFIKFRLNSVIFGEEVVPSVVPVPAKCEMSEQKTIRIQKKRKKDGELVTMKDTGFILRGVRSISCQRGFFDNVFTSTFLSDMRLKTPKSKG